MESIAAVLSSRSVADETRGALPDAPVRTSPPPRASRTRLAAILRRIADRLEPARESRAAVSAGGR